MRSEGHAAPRRPRGDRRRAFTLIELLVVVAAIAILAMLLFGALQRARRLARDSTCKSNLSQLWKATNLYANNHEDSLFHNTATPLLLSNLAYKDQSPSGWGFLYPHYVADHRVFFCPGDPVRDPAWAYGWGNWDSPDGEVQTSYGYRGRQGLVDDADTPLCLADVDYNPQKVLGCDYYGDETAPPNTHHATHINLLRCNGRVVAERQMPAFAADAEVLEEALRLLDR